MPRICLASEMAARTGFRGFIRKGMCMASRGFCLAILLCLLFPAITAATDHYVATNGSPSGDGSMGNPWDLQTALNQPASVQPGDTIWLLGGTYVSTSGGFLSNLNGTETSPIIVRNYDWQRVTIDGQVNSMALEVLGSYTWFWGLEIMSSCTQRVLIQTTAVCAVGVGAYGPDDKYINLIVHDTSQGFSAFNASPDNEFYGNLIYYNGFVGPNRNYGHGMYLQNDTGTKTVSENFVGDNADEGIQIYGSGNADLINFFVSANTLYNTGSWPTPNYQYNLIIGGGANRQNITVENNYSYFPAGVTFEDIGGEPAQLGQYTTGQDMTVTNNVFANGYAPLNFTDQTGPVVFTGNTVVAAPNAIRPVTLDVYSGQPLAAYTWDNNTYFDQGLFHFYVGYTTDGSDFSGVNTSFAGWQSETGYDTNSTYNPNAPTGTWVYVQPNEYEVQRANVTIFNWDQLPAVSVDLSSVLSPGDQYVIQDAQNFYGPAVASGMYSGGTVSISMTGLTKATPIGFAAPAHTAPIFGTFVVLPVGIPPTMPPGTDTNPPSVSILLPASGANVSGTITVAASASDSVGIASVQFTLDGNNLGSPISTAPYSTSWDTLGAIALDTAGNSASSSISVTVSNYVVGIGPAGTAGFVGSDTVTQGNWMQQYGSDGYSLAKAGQSLPVYDSTFNASQLANWTWASPSTDLRALETDATGDRIAATWYGGPFSFAVNVTDGQIHQIAVYAIDWDNKGRTETVQILDGSSGAILDSRTIPGASTSTTSANFVGGAYLIWNVSGSVVINVISNAGPNGVISGIFWGGAPVSITATSGTPQSASTGSAFAPLIATVTSGGSPANGVEVTFTAPTTGASGTFQGGSNVATVMSVQGVATAPVFTANSTTGGPYTVKATAPGATTPANFSLTNTGQVDAASVVEATIGTPQSASTNSAFATQLQATVLDASNNALSGVTVTFAAPASGASGTFSGSGNTATAITNGLGVATASTFTANGTAGGPYTVTASVPGASQAGFQLTNTQPTGCSGDCASFLSEDTTTEGAWQSKYGADGYSLAGSAQSLPSYGSLSLQGQSSYTWAATTNDPRALQVPGNPLGIAASWYGGTFTLNVNVGSNTHQVGLYFLDWDIRGRAEKVQIFDANLNSATPLDTETVSNFSTGVYLLWNISGSVRIVVTGAAGPNAVASGIFFGGGPQAAVVTSFTEDTSTEGAWQAKYGADGYSLANSVQSIPGYAAFGVENSSTYTWNPATSDLRALQIPGSATGIAAAWYGGTFTFDVNVGTSPHQVALYLLDWDNTGRAEQIQIFDANSGSATPLVTENASNFSTGVYLIWSITGHVKIVIMGTAGPNAVVSGVFFGGAPTPATVNSFSRDTTTEGAWPTKYGSNGYSIADSAQSLPGYASLTMQGQGGWTWNPATTDPRALQIPGSTLGIAAAWYGGTFSFDVNVGTTAHQVELYVLDWDNQGRAEQVQIFDAGSGSTTPLDTETVSNFNTGVYLIWNISGNVRIVVTGTAGPNAAVSGIFFQ